MSKEAFTPGPWHFLEAIGHDDEWSSVNPLTVCSDGNDDLASIFSDADSTVSIPRVQSVANAHLIAAGPEMYEALKDLSEAFQARIDGTGGTNAELRELAAAREALSKARGEAQ